MATAVLAAVLAWPIHALVAANEFAVILAACASLGTAGLVVLAASAWNASGRERDDVLDVLLPALILPAFVVLAHPMVFLTSALWPTTFDHRLYLADAAFGAPLSFVVGRAVAAVPFLPAICMAVYVGLPLALMLVHTLRARRGIRSGDALVAFVAVTVVGYFGYLAAPVAGPVYAFGDLFPQHPPDPATLGSAKSLVLPMPRNCMPSLHSAWALLVWWNARPLARGPRAAAAVFLAITLLATVGLGFHYVVDLVAAFPLTMAAQAWATRVTNQPLRRRAIAVGLVATVAWMALVTWSDLMLQWPAAACWLLASAVVAGSWRLESLVYATRCEATPPELVVASPPSWIDRAVALSLVLVGLAGFLHWAIAANALGLVFGATQPVRAGLVTVSLAALGVGLAIGGVAATRGTRPLRTAALTAAGLALTCWAWPRTLPWIDDTFVVVAGPLSAGTSQPLAAILALSMAALVPTALFTGLTVAFLARHPGTGHRSPARATALAFGLPLVGAALGSLATGYILVPSLRSSAAPAIVAVAVALLVAILSTRRTVAACSEWERDAAEDPRREVDERRELSDDGSGERRDGGNDGGSADGVGEAAVMLFATAAIAGTVATICMHLLTVVAGDTVHSRAQAPFLLWMGLGAGALLAGRFDVDGTRRRFGTVLALAGLAATVAIGLSLWNEVPGYFASFRDYAEQHKVTTTFAEREFVRLVAGALLLLLPMLCAGAALSFGGGLPGRDRNGNPGSALAVTALAVVPFTILAVAAVVGALLGMFTAAHGMLPLLGSRRTLEVAALLACMTGAVAIRKLPVPARSAGTFALAAAAVLLLALPRPLEFDRLAAGSGLAFRPEPEDPAMRWVDRIEGLVSVHQSSQPEVRRIVVDGVTRAQRRIGEGAAPPAARELAGLAHARGRHRALVAGIGTGAAVRILLDAGFRDVTVAEPNAAVVEMATASFEAFLTGTLDDERTSAVLLDGRSALTRSDAPYDLLVIDALDITLPDAASLHTREFYETGAARLAPGGVLQQNLALRHFSATGIVSVLASARRSFEKVRVYFVGEHATMVACSGDCESTIDSNVAAPERELLVGIGQANGLDPTKLDDGGWLDPAAIDRLLESTAEQLGVPVEALGSKDLDMFLPYHAPRSLLEPYDASPASLVLLRRFQVAPPAAPPAGR